VPPSQRFARSLGAVWAGDAATSPPEELDAAIIFAPVGELVPQALRAVTTGGIVVCGGIHMSDIPSFPFLSKKRMMPWRGCAAASCKGRPYW
jgi:propanol-preferring alcohol dehydrogenase